MTRSTSVSTIFRCMSSNLVTFPSYDVDFLNLQKDRFQVAKQLIAITVAYLCSSQQMNNGKVKWPRNFGPEVPEKSGHGRVRSPSLLDSDNVLLLSVKRAITSKVATRYHDPGVLHKRHLSIFRVRYTASLLVTASLTQMGPRRISKATVTLSSYIFPHPRVTTQFLEMPLEI